MGVHKHMFCHLSCQQFVPTAIVMPSWCHYNICGVRYNSVVDIGGKERESNHLLRYIISPWHNWVQGS